MKKTFLVLLFAAAIIFLCGCQKEVLAEDLVRDFVKAYGAEGEIYSSGKMIHEEGYIPEGLMEKIYVIGGKLPDNYAFYLNKRSSSGFEFAAFVCDDENERASVTEMCYERLALLNEGKEKGLLVRSGKLVVYTTASDKDRAEKLIKKIIGAYY